MNKLTTRLQLADAQAMQARSVLDTLRTYTDITDMDFVFSINSEEVVSLSIPIEEFNFLYHIFVELEKIYIKQGRALRLAIDNMNQRDV